VPVAPLERGPAPDRFAVYALHYAQRTGVRGQHLSGHDDRSAEPHDTAYYVWLAVSSTITVLVDAGMDREVAVPLDGFRFRSSPLDALTSIGIGAADIDCLVLTHLHYDHTGCARHFDRARCVIQRAEVEYWTGPAAIRNTREAWLHSAADTSHLFGPEAAGRLDLVDGDHALLPGVSVHLVGGHTAGLQVVRVETAAGPVVLASDACHFYENLSTDRPSPIVHSTPAAYAAFDRVRELAAPDGVVIPGHDPEVLERFQPPLISHVIRIR
jgi:glyoxylase-like metal-dependent hydrolase (beta-lactamase superfamily II)